ncbi:NlpC/P60 family protein [Bernardetia sp. ABR2-2B]|uniref:C40 family peptidase n=1 Tax=Bernardetia sp. ABR2-2B TaxID=3127472 RepID=UPI0030D310A2
MKSFNFTFLFIISVLFFSSCSNFKIVTINDMNKNKENTESNTLKNKVKISNQESESTSTSENYKESLSKAEKVVDAAREQLGTPHLLKNPKKKSATDCSGMTCKSYSVVGVNLPRTTTGQAEMGKFVSKKALQKGDLVFFTSKKNNRRISHVGLISRVEKDGSVYFIHTSTSRGVVEDDFYMKHWQDNFVTARRVL